MKYAIAIAGMMWVGAAVAQQPGEGANDLTQGTEGDANMGSKPNWNLFIVDSIQVTPHLYKTECEALLHWLYHRDLALHAECFETPK